MVFYEMYGTRQSTAALYRLYSMYRVEYGLVSMANDRGTTRSALSQWPNHYLSRIEEGGISSVPTC